MLDLHGILIQIEFYFVRMLIIASVCLGRRSDRITCAKCRKSQSHLLLNRCGLRKNKLVGKRGRGDYENF